MEVGLRIRAYIDEHGITQQFLVRKTGINAQKINLSLNGHRRIPFDEYELICGALGVGVDQFLTPRKLEEVTN